MEEQFLDGISRRSGGTVPMTSTSTSMRCSSFAGLQSRRANLHDPAGAVGHLRAATLNGARSVLRRRRVARQHVPPHDAGADPPDACLLLDEEHPEVLTAVRALPRRQQEVVTLRYWLHLTEAEIATTLKISRGTVKSNAARALDKLEKALGERQ